MRDLDRLSHTRSDTSENRVGSFAFGFFGLLCAMAVGFVSELRPPVSIQLTTATMSYSKLCGKVGDGVSQAADFI